MTQNQHWVIIYPNGDRSRSFETYEQIISFLESRRDLEPNIKYLMGPNNIIISKEKVWNELKNNYNSGYTK